MEFFRSEPMALCQIILHTESAFDCLIELGYLGKVQFRSSNDNEVIAQYRTEVLRCHKLERMMLHLESEIKDLNMRPVFYPDVDEDEVPQASDLKKLEDTILEFYEELTEVEENIDGLRKQRNNLYEKLEVLKKAHLFLTGGDNSDAVMAWTDSVIMQLLHDELRPTPKEHMHLSFVAGTVPMEKFRNFELMLWRVTMGNYLLKTTEIEFSQEDKARASRKMIRKMVFVIFFVGTELKEKISKICQGFDIKLFKCPESSFARQDEMIQIIIAIDDFDRIMKQTQEHQYNILLIASADSYIWKVKLKKMLMVYHTLNGMGRVRHLHMKKYLQAECWIPVKDIRAVRSALLRGVNKSSKGNPVQMFLPMLNVIYKRGLTKPTYFELNRFTRSFQNLIDSYGIAKYMELNPAPYTIITFPFLFAVMFGDVGHGIIMLIFGLWMVSNEKELEERKRVSDSSNEIWDNLFAGRYIITLMGAFSIYTGFIYNVIFSKSINIFGSAWVVNFNKSTVTSSHYLQLNPSTPDNFRGTPYEMGFDPVWGASGENAISTSNSFKMKLSLILGVTQMVFGLVLSALNFIYDRNYIDLCMVFVPQIVFLLCIFGYLVFLVFYKWMFFGGHLKPPYSSGCAPSILIMFINMMLMKSSDVPLEGCEQWMFKYQGHLQPVLLATALICIPILLAGKPICLIIQRDRIRRIKNASRRKMLFRDIISNIRKSLIYNIEDSATQLSVRHGRRTSTIEKQSVGEMWIHSGIHCIESVLGAISHTASYLRLWALSLAHDQLSLVLWYMVLNVGLSGDFGAATSIVLALAFSFWAVLTIAILVIMEGLSAFLHTLRLHWVEFQSKFYNGSGEKFIPFKFERSTVAG